MNEINILGVFIATFIGMALGALWYSPILFGNAWMKCIDKTPETIDKSTIPMIGSIVASILTAVGISLLFLFINVTHVSIAISIGAILGLLIIFPTLLSDNLFCSWGNKLLLIQSGYRVTSIMLMSLAMYYV